MKKSIILALIATMAFSAIVTGCSTGKSSSSSSVSEAKSSSVENNNIIETTSPKNEETTAPIETEQVEATVATTKSSTPSISREYQNALGSAESYLSYTAFSKEGLYEQLIFDKYSDEAARYAVDNVSTDWKENAVKAAESYLSYSTFSKQELYEQLIFEKYTDEEAQYAVDKVY